MTRTRLPQTQTLYFYVVFVPSLWVVLKIVKLNFFCEKLNVSRVEEREKECEVIPINASSKKFFIIQKNKKPNQRSQGRYKQNNSQH
jgi:hypothetical protein